jgi:osmotically-inducible protein OsmY
MRRWMSRMVGGAIVTGGLVVFRPGTHANKAVRHGIAEAARRLRYLAGQLQGIAYRLAGRHPDPDVDDLVLADRIRSQLGGLEKERDLPRVHVMVEKHVALLHGDVGTQDDADAIERAVAGVSGVQGVESHLHVGLIRGDTRPSEGHARDRS